MNALTRTLLAGSVTAVGAIAYSAVYERNAFVLRQVSAPVLPPGSAALTVLHVSDIHMMPDQSRKQRWLRGLADVEPDLVVSTGDNLAHPNAVPAVLRAYGDLLDLPGVFVLGSNDYFSPTMKNPARYLWSDSGSDRRRARDMPYEVLRSAFVGAGWVDLDNASASVRVAGLDLAFVGVDDPHLGFDDLPGVVPADPGADLAIAVAHAPYLRVLDRFNEQGYRLVLAGHTHGGQLCIPGFGALVTNCDLDRRRAKGLHRHSTGRHPSWLNVSAGCGTSPYAPVRFACRPEATLLTLTPVDSPRLGDSGT